MSMTNMESPSFLHRLGAFLHALLIRLAGLDEELLRDCPLYETTRAQVLAILRLLCWVFESALLSLVGHRLISPSGQFHLSIVLGAILISTLVLWVEDVGVVAPSWISEGIDQLRKYGGVDLSRGFWDRANKAIFVFIRVGLFAIPLSAVSGIFIGLLIFGPDVLNRLQKEDLEKNAPLVAKVTQLIDADLDRASKAEALQVDYVKKLEDQLSALRQNEVDPASADPTIQQAQQTVSRLEAQKANADLEVANAEAFAANEGGGIIGDSRNSGVPGYGPRHRAAMERVKGATAYAQKLAGQLDEARRRLDGLRDKIPAVSDTARRQADNRLAEFDKTLEEERTKLTNLRNKRTDLTDHRDETIRKMVEQAPDHVPFDGGILAQVRALEEIAEQNTKIAALIALIDVLAFALETCALTAKLMSPVPMKCSLLMARRAYTDAARIGQDLLAELDAMEKKGRDHSEPTEPAPAESPPPNRPLNGGPGATATPGPTPGDTSVLPTQPPKRKRGRPPKNRSPATPTGPNGQESPEPLRVQPGPA